MPRTNTRPQLRHKIGLRLRGGALNALRERVATYGDAVEVWADVRPLSAGEAYRAARMEQKITHRAIIRYRDDVAQEDGVEWRDRWFIVETVHDPDERQEWMHIMMHERNNTDAPA